MIIKRWFKYILALIFHYGGYNWWRMWLSKRNYILMFHRLEDAPDLLNISLPLDYLQLVVDWSSSIGEIVSIAELIAGEESKNRFCMTFDDGFTNVKRISEISSEFPFILYASTAYIGTNKVFWAVELERLISETNSSGICLLDFDLGQYDISNRFNKDRVISKLNNDIKKLHPVDIEAILKYLGNTLQVASKEENNFLTWDEVRYLHKNGMEVGGHTHNHVISSKVTPNEFSNEIKLSNALIKNNVGVTPRHFAYPNGRKQDISIFSHQILIDEGYDSAVTTIEGPNKINEDPYMLKRYNLSRDRIESPWGFPSKAMFTTMLVNPIGHH